MKTIDITKLPTFYINLDEREDRKEKMETMLSDLDFKNVQRFPATKAGSRVGCSISHMNLLDYIITNNIYPCLVLEDDVDIFDFRKKIQCPENADAMYLGFSGYGFNLDKESLFPRSLKISELNKDFHRVHNMLARHAIIHFNPEYDQKASHLMQVFIDLPKEFIAGDVTLTRLHPNYKVYAQNSPVFYQNDEGTRGLTKKSLKDAKYVELDKV
jgi:hypothetical protein